MTQIFLILMITLFLCTGCGSFQSKKNWAKQLDEQSLLIQKQARVIQDLSDENLILRELVSPNQSIPLVGSQKKMTSGKTEEFLYAQVIKGYRERKELLLKQAKDLLVKMYPDSVYIDNAAYLLGRYYYDNGEYGKALKAYEYVLSHYPKGDRRVAAMLGKGLAYKMLNLTRQTNSLLSEVIAKYPGSPESSQARFELKALKYK